MIAISEKKNCCGCEACVQRCPKSCITLKEDNEGFLYPEVNKDACIDCGLCNKVCPVENQGHIRQPVTSLAAFNKNKKERDESSSGGIFCLMAAYVIKELHGVVFGAKYNERWEVVHDYVEEEKDIKLFQQSKYSQSHMGNTFSQAESFLKEGRYVLFSATPCQIAALRLFLRKDYEKLITLDFICHGVPSPGILRWYLNEQLQQHADLQNEEKALAAPISNIPSREHISQWKTICIQHLTFRAKPEGWNKFHFSLTLTKNAEDCNPITAENRIWRQNPYMRGFIWNIYLRPSCYNCPAKSLKSGSDITIADLWGARHIVPEMDDDKGLSAVCLNTEKGFTIFKKIDCEKKVIDYQLICRHNKPICESAIAHKNRDKFWKGIPLKKGNLSRHITRNLTSRKEKIKKIIKKILKKIKLK